MNRKLIPLREADTLEIDEAAPDEAKAAHKALEALLKVEKLPKSVRDHARAARTALAKRLPVWDDLSTDDPVTEAQIEDEFSPIPLVEAEAGAGEFDVRIMSPGWGSTGYYSPECLQEAAKNRVFKAGLRMFWDHPTKAEERERPERSLSDLAGKLVTDAVYQESGRDGPGLYARVAAYKHYRPAIAEMAKDIGLSIRGDGVPGEVRTRPDGRPGRVIESIARAKSVDFVTAPGRGGKVLELFEAARHSEEEPDMDLEEAIRERDAATKRAKDLEEANRAQTDELARYRAAAVLSEAQTIANEHLKASKLPELVKTRVISEAVRSAQVKDGKLDTDALKTAITEAEKTEVAYLEGLLGKGKVTGMGSGGGATTDITEAEQTSLSNRILEGFTRLGLSEAEAKHAAAGR